MLSSYSVHVESSIHKKNVSNSATATSTPNHVSLSLLFNEGWRFSFLLVPKFGGTALKHPLSTWTSRFWISCVTADVISYLPSLPVIFPHFVKKLVNIFVNHWWRRRALSLMNATVTTCAKNESEVLHSRVKVWMVFRECCTYAHYGLKEVKFNIYTASKLSCNFFLHI